MLGNPHWLRRGVDGGPQGKLIGGVKALYWERPKPAEMEQAGVTVADYASPEQRKAGVYYDLEDADWRFDLWAENWPAIHLYLQYQSQWRVGPNGPTGLDYNVLFHELDRRGLDEDAYEDLMSSIRVIEQAALKILTEK